MKKIFLLFLILFAFLFAFAFNESAKVLIPMRNNVYHKLADCIPAKQKYYGSNGFSVIHEIIGMKEDKCIFEYCDILTTDGFVVKCHFNKKVLGKITKNSSKDYSISDRILNDESICIKTKRKDCTGDVVISIARDVGFFSFIYFLGFILILVLFFICILLFLKKLKNNKY